ncbi:MAG: hypothetical protein VM34scaffold347_61 [Phage 66_12]|nr:MAG: hypothetical protein VM34scaffold347_61 [Phage 66_12]
MSTPRGRRSANVATLLAVVVVLIWANSGPVWGVVATLTAAVVWHLSNAYGRRYL